MTTAATHTSAPAVTPRGGRPDDAEPRRLTPTERLHEVTLAFAHRAASPPEHSVTISRNAKGVFQFEVTVRGYDVRGTFDEAELIANTLAAAYPYPESGESA